MQSIVITVVSFFLGAVFCYLGKEENKKEHDAFSKFSNGLVIAMGILFFIYGTIIQINALSVPERGDSHRQSVQADDIRR